MRHVAFVLGIAVACHRGGLFVLAQEPVEVTSESTWDEAVAILEKVNDAAKAVGAVRYQGSYRGTGWLKDRVAAVEGTAVIGGISIENRRFRGFERFHFDVHVRETGAEKVKHFTAGHDGRTFYLIDWQSKTAHANTDRAVLGSDGRLAQSIGMLEFVHPTPFDDEINGDEVELRGTAMVGDQECHVIYVAYAYERGEATWYFSKKDFLPRRVDRLHRRDGEMATTELVVTNLVTDPASHGEELALAVPDGFERTEVFAIDRQAGLRTPPLLRY